MSQLDELRQIIIGDNSAQLTELKQRIENVEQRTKDVAEVLSPAIEKELSSQQSGIVDSLQKPVTLGLKKAIRSEPQEYAEILYPVMAPSIRRAISQAISSMMVTINRTIESATTAQGLSLRYESLRTGIPYAELALRQTLLYRVEHLYLIDQNTGMAMTTLHADNAQSLDSDAVSAMFSAIQSFIHDSFSVDEGSRLTDLKVGDQNVWVVHGASAMLACVIRGEAPVSLRQELYDALDMVRTDFANEIAEYDGDAAKFMGARSILQPLLRSELKQEDSATENKKKDKPVGPILFSLGVLAALTWLVVHWYDSYSRLSTVKHFLDQTPGITANHVIHDDGKIVVQGLKDPDAIIPYQTLNSYGIAESDIRFATVPVRSLEPEMELARFTNEFSLPTGVSLYKKDGKIYLEGDAPYEWLKSNQTRILNLASDKRLNISRLAADEQSVRAAINARYDSVRINSMTSSIKTEHSKMGVVNIELEVSSKEFASLVSSFSGIPWVKIEANIK